jgi:outer membrane protein insertion porin family
VPTDASQNAGAVTTCSIGYSSALGGACSGSTVNTIVPPNQISPFVERFLGDSASPRLSVGVGINWNSPFGPLRINVAKALLSQPGDDKKLITFNVGTQF